LNKLDQVVYGMTALNLYKDYGDDKYLRFSERLISFVDQHVNEKGILFYRVGQKAVLNDALGMAVPFLSYYANVTGDSSSLQLAKRQLNMYIEFGVDEETFLPSHAYNSELKMKVGSSNW